MQIRTLQDCYDIFSSVDRRTFGIGVTAFMRIMPALFMRDKFSIICYKNSLDLDILSKYTEIFCLQKQKNGKKIEKFNTSNILSHPVTKTYCKQYPGSYLFIYKNSKPTQQIADKFGFTIINNRSKIRENFENKKHFRSILKKVGFSPIPGKNIPLRKFLWMEYSDFTKEFGKRLVVQLPDFKTGGGKGTIFINNKKEFDNFVKKIFGGKYKDIEIRFINITKFIEGVSCSIIGCATKYGTFSSTIQTQLIDIPEVINTKKGGGLFCGHDWSFKHFSTKVQKEASLITQKLGTYMYKQGYKGIFGLDLIVDEKNEKVYVVECNSRYTGAFPMISMLDMQKGIPPMDVFHILEHMNIPYTVDFESMDKKYKYNKEGSHIILSNKEEKSMICKKDLLPGIYTYENKQLKYQRPGLLYSDIKNKDEFIIIDGNPRKGQKIRPFNELSRFCHLLFPGQIAVAQNKINIRTKNIIETIYHEFIL